MWYCVVITVNSTYVMVQQVRELGSNKVLQSAILPGINKSSQYLICMCTHVYGVCNTCCWDHVEKCSSTVTCMCTCCTHWNSTLGNYVLQPQLCHCYCGIPVYSYTQSWYCPGLSELLWYVYTGIRVNNQE